MTHRPLILATRASKLALIQAHLVKTQLESVFPKIKIELLTLSTTGDQRTDISLAHIGGKELFAKELQKAVLEKKADFAVHSLKDLGAVSPEGLTLAAVCKRADPRDAFLSEKYPTFADLPAGAIVGTSSPRRQCLLLNERPDLKIKLLRGNIQTRLNKLNQGEYDAIVLAAAGLERLQLQERIKDFFDPNEFIPAIGQGTIAIECRTSDINLQTTLLAINHYATELCVTAERTLNAHLGGDCFTPLGAHAILENKLITLNAMVGTSDGRALLRSNAFGPMESTKQLGIQAAVKLLNQGAKRFLQTE